MLALQLPGQCGFELLCGTDTEDLNRVEGADLFAAVVRVQLQQDVPGAVDTWVRKPAQYENRV